MMLILTLLLLLRKIQTSTTTSPEPNTGYRIVNMENLAAIFNRLSCQSCCENSNKLKISEILSKKKTGVLFLFAMLYSQKKCPLLPGVRYYQVSAI